MGRQQPSEDEFPYGDLEQCFESAWKKWGGEKGRQRYLQKLLSNVDVVSPRHEVLPEEFDISLGPWVELTTDELKDRWRDTIRSAMHDMEHEQDRLVYRIYQKAKSKHDAVAELTTGSEPWWPDSKPVVASRGTGRGTNDDERAQEAEGMLAWVEARRRFMEQQRAAFDAEVRYLDALEAKIKGKAMAEDDVSLTGGSSIDYQRRVFCAYLKNLGLQVVCIYYLARGAKVIRKHESEDSFKRTLRRMKLDSGVGALMRLKEGELFPWREVPGVETTPEFL